MQKKLKCNKPVKSWRKGKKYAVKACKGNKEKIIHYGALGYEDFTMHKDKERKKNFRARHRCDSDKPNFFSARQWSCEDLWS